MGAIVFYYNPTQKRPRRPEKGHSKRAAEKEVLKQVFWQTTNETSNENTKGGISRRFSRQSPPLRTDPEETSQTRKRTLKKSSRKRGPAAVFWQTTNETS